MRGVYSIDAECPFLTSFARGLIEAHGDNLASCLVILPSRRACFSLRDAFLDVVQEDALLLPRMQPVGDLGSDEPLLAPAIAHIPQAIDPLRRQLLLAELVRKQRETQGGITDEHAIRLAGELAAFLDEMQTEEIELERLTHLVPDEHAVHWQQILRFLGILGEAWPLILAEEDKVDPPERRRLLLDLVMENWTQFPPRSPIIAAGLTGTVPAVGRLITQILNLPLGAVVLPGLDLDMDEVSWQAVEAAPAHPQYGLKKLLERMEIDRALVRPWPGAKPVTSPARRQFLGEIMRPAATSEAWKNIPKPSSEALAGLERFEAANFASEANVITLKIRQALEAPNVRVSLITSDRTLARRVAVELKRFDIDADDTAGVPLDQSPPGSFLLLAARAIIDDLAPVPLLSLLKHPLSSGHIERGQFRRHVRAFERSLLRGPRLSGGFAGYLDKLEGESDKYWPVSITKDELKEWLLGLESAAEPLVRLARQPKVSFADLIDTHLAFAEWLASDELGSSAELWAKEAGEAATLFLARLREAILGFSDITPSAYPALMAVLMSGDAVRPLSSRHPRLNILGQLESRLASSDVTLIAGLNEGVWPRGVEPSPWINRSMRKALGLPPVELQIGIAAHDLVMAASSKTCVLSRSSKDHGGAPTTASRWLLRLDAVLRATGYPGAIDAPAHWYDWADALDRPEGAIEPCARPNPKPPIEARPSEAWVTEIEQLIRDPYTFYAKQILALRSLDPIDADPGGAERGQIIHQALETFVRTFPIDLPEDALIQLLAIGERLFDGLGHHPQVRAIWWPRFCEIAQWFLEQERQRRAHLNRITVERSGALDIDTETGKFTLKARADRIEVDSTGQINLVDYKTGNLPSQKDINAGISPQLTLSGVIATQGGFDGTPYPAGELLYWGLKGGHKGSQARSLQQVDQLIEAARKGIAELVDWYRDPENGYPAVPRPEIALQYNEYEHLARIDEWRGATLDRDEPK